MEQLNFGDFVESAQEFKPIVSNDWKWGFKDYPKKNGLKVFSCFACGGGSTMGYKLAGCDVIGCLEIDKKVNDVYVKNHNPKFNYLMDIREFNDIPNEELPPELFNLDILDGSPPCTTFSMAGDREDSWGKEKKFREGQAMQTLDDLLFVFIETAKKLKPKCVIMENVEGLLLGDAWKYVQEVYKQFNLAGYQVHHWLLKGEKMGVPQARHRVFFVALRSDIDFYLPNLDMAFNYKEITFGDIKEGEGAKPSETAYKLLDLAIEKDKSLGDVLQRVEKRTSMFNVNIVWDNQVCPTVHAHGMYRGNDKVKLTDEDYRNASTFPYDYDFCNQKPAYICGMCVPPVMTKRIVDRITKQIFFDLETRFKGETNDYSRSQRV